MHARKRGKSGSKKPERSSAHTWITYELEEVEELIVKLAKAGDSPSMIGLILRDNYGISSVKDVTGKNIGYFLKKNDLQGELPEDLKNLIKKVLKLKKHLDQHKKDRHNKRGLNLMEAKILRLTKYYKSTGRLPADWHYDLKKAKMM